jgi:hypothetical protein
MTRLRVFQNWLRDVLFGKPVDLVFPGDPDPVETALVLSWELVNTVLREGDVGCPAHRLPLSRCIEDHRATFQEWTERAGTPPEVPVDPLLEEAWGIIANAGWGDWSRESPEWQGAAARWRKRYHERLDVPRPLPTP